MDLQVRKRFWCCFTGFASLIRLCAGLTDLLAELDEFHLCWHVSHSPHALAQVFTADEAVLIFVKFSEGLTQLCKSGTLYVWKEDLLLGEGLYSLWWWKVINEEMRQSALMGFSLSWAVWLKLLAAAQIQTLLHQISFRLLFTCSFGVVKNNHKHLIAFKELFLFIII